MSDTPDLVLLVDDEKSILDVLSMGFKKAGIPVKTAINAEDAILQLESFKFGAVVTDKNLPGKSGLDLLKVIRERYPHCARVVITGFVNTESVLEAMKLGADDYLLKPFESIMLVIERVKQAMKHRKVQQEREALAKALRELEKTLRKSEHTTFWKRSSSVPFWNAVCSLLRSDFSISRSARASSSRSSCTLRCFIDCFTRSTTSMMLSKGLSR